MSKFEQLISAYRNEVQKCKEAGHVKRVANVAWEGDWDEEDLEMPHAALASQLSEQQAEMHALREELGAQTKAREAEAQAVQEKERAAEHEKKMMVEGAVKFVLQSGGGHSCTEAEDAVRDVFSSP